MNFAYFWIFPFHIFGSWLLVSKWNCEEWNWIGGYYCISTLSLSSLAVSQGDFDIQTNTVWSWDLVHPFDQKTGFIVLPCKNWGHANKWDPTSYSRSKLINHDVAGWAHKLRDAQRGRMLEGRQGKRWATLPKDENNHEPVNNKPHITWWSWDYLS
jgi:hypothetical protein